MADQKKSKIAQERDEDVRGLWRWLAPRFDARRLVFVDESGFHTSMIVDGATDSEAFEAYVEHFLAPTLRSGQVVVLDGLGAHRTEKVRELVEERGADLVFLPSYSPDLNPIEVAFSKIKALVRKEGARVREALVEAIGRALATVTPEDAAGWFAHAGYWPHDQPL